MATGLAPTINGAEGSIRIRALGSTIGKMASWTLKRRRGRDDELTDDGLWDLRANMVYLNAALLADPDYTHEVRVVIDRRTGKQYRVEQQPGFEPKVQGITLLMEGVKLCPA